MSNARIRRKLLLRTKRFDTFLHRQIPTGDHVGEELLQCADGDYRRFLWVVTRDGRYLASYDDSNGVYPSLWRCRGRGPIERVYQDCRAIRARYAL